MAAELAFATICTGQSYRSRFRRRPIAQLDVHRQAGAALRIRPSCGTCPARASSSLAARLENLSDVNHGAQIFQVRQGALDARERSVYRKTVLTRIEGKRQHPASLDWT